jgi:hypothetical protein
MHDLPVFGTLETMAEVGAALFAISGIVSVFGRRESLPWMIQDKVWLGGLLNWSFILIVAGFTPSIMRELFDDIEMVWVSSHSIFLVAHIASYLWFSFSFFIVVGARSYRRIERLIVIPSLLIATCVIIAQLYVVLARSPYLVATYVVATGWFIYVACTAFSFMLFPRTTEERADPLAQTERV